MWAVGSGLGAGAFTTSGTLHGAATVAASGSRDVDVDVMVTVGSTPVVALVSIGSALARVLGAIKVADRAASVRVGNAPRSVTAISAAGTLH